MAAAPSQPLLGSSSALPLPWPSLGADLQTLQGWALLKHQWDERDRSKAKNKAGQEAEQSTAPSHPSCFLPGLSSALSSPNTSRDLPMWLSPQALMSVLLIFTTAALFFTEEQHPVDFPSS